jgi:ABC-type multidrug transport system ATPase subunit
MSDAALLCDKIAILVNGHIVSFGSPSYLLKTYGGGYEINVIVDITKADYLEAYKEISAQFSDVTVMFQGYIDNQVNKWQMVFKTSVEQPSRIFDVMGKLLAAQEIESFTTTRIRLEEIYTAFSRFQHQYDKKEKMMVNNNGRVCINGSSRYSEFSNSQRQTERYSITNQLVLDTAHMQGKNDSLIMDLTNDYK